MSTLSTTLPFPDRPTPVTQSSLGSVIEQIGITVSDEPTGNTPDDYSNSSWAAPKFFSDLSAFNITHFASGRDNLEVVAGVTFDAAAHADDLSSWTSWTNASTMLQLFYPKDSINPAGWPQGGSEFYAAPLDLRNARNVTFAYSVFFPSDFEWVKGGKLPGLYGGHTGCSGGNAALDCFSTRLMWRAGGAGELYLYAPKHRQKPSLCNAPPLSVCDTTYGLSIARGSFEFSLGSWTHVSQTVVLNSPGVQDGGFLLEVDGKAVIDRADVLYRDYHNDGFGHSDTFKSALSTFFGGHHREFASPKDQFVWFKDFSLYINDPSDSLYSSPLYDDG
ncbi:hypothetical protein BJV78DRAFT_1119893 [Lactifluus subvellereus]|nr:hypothetical protein BJV78DRAFT_1119893 [Lactifluus subvellereus]